MIREFEVVLVNKYDGRKYTKAFFGECHDDCDTITDKIQHTQKAWDEWTIHSVTEITVAQQCG